LESVPSSLYQTHSYDLSEKYSPFVETHKTGSILSQYVNARLRVKLSDLLELGSETQFPCDDAHFGKTTIRLELEDVKRLVVKTELDKGKNTDSSLVIGADAFAANVAPTTLSFDPANAENVLTCAITPLTFPFFVNQNVFLRGQIIAELGPYVNVYTHITNIVYNSETNKWDVTFADAFPMTLPGNIEGTGYQNITLAQVLPLENADGSYGSWTINTVELGLVEVMNPSVALQELQYTTFSIEEFSCDATNVLNKQFTIEPECVNVFCLFNDVVTGNLLSHNTDVSSYRFIVNGEQVVDRDVLINIDYSALSNQQLHSPLHYEMVRRLFRNADIPIHSMTSLQQNVKAVPDMLRRVNAIEQSCLILGCPVNMTANPKQFQLNLNMKSEQTISGVTLFKHLIKNVKF
jgi:hypothetical protein